MNYFERTCYFRISASPSDKWKSHRNKNSIGRMNSIHLLLISTAVVTYTVRSTRRSIKIVEAESQPINFSVIMHLINNFRTSDIGYKFSHFRFSHFWFSTVDTLCTLYFRIWSPGTLPTQKLLFFFFTFFCYGFLWPFLCILDFIIIIIIVMAWQNLYFWWIAFLNHHNS